MERFFLLLSVVLFSITGCTKKTEDPSRKLKDASGETQQLSDLQVYEWSPVGGFKSSFEDNFSIVCFEGSSSENDWSLAHSQSFQIEGGAKVRFSVEMLVKSYQNKAVPPRLVLQIRDKGEWLTNFIGSNYDLNKTNTWQRLSSDEVILPKGEALTGGFTLDKADIKSALTANICLKNVKIENVK